MGGEEWHPAWRRRMGTGLPPRGRGRAAPALASPAPSRITPAWAGKRCRLEWVTVPLEDYPRVGGEEDHDDSSVAGCAGLPPRGRGRVGHFVVREAEGRITPAWAGKSYVRGTQRPWLWDYPRVGGEEVRTDNVMNGNEGLPPRGRGRASACVGVLMVPRITPAWAGKSGCVLDTR